MILHALRDYYERMRSSHEVEMPEYGFAEQGIHYECVIDEKGTMIALNPLGGIIEKGKNKGKTLPMQIAVPSFRPDPKNGEQMKMGKRTSSIEPFFLWDKTDYVLGIDSDVNETPEHFKSFRNYVQRIAAKSDDAAMKAVIAFLNSWKTAEAKMKLGTALEKIKGRNLIFRIDGERRFVCDHLEIRKAYQNYVSEHESPHTAFCLIDGQESKVAETHPPIKGVKGTSQPQVPFVSFNIDSACSYSKEQSLNAPISNKSAFSYTAALNHLLRRDDRKVQIGDATTVFWAEKASPLEGFLAKIFSPQAEDTSAVGEIRNFLEAVRQGRMPSEIDAQTKFYILGLSPNASRLSVRFWYAGTVGELSTWIGKHFRDIQIEKKRDDDEEYPAPLWWRKGKDGKVHPEGLLLGVAVKGKIDNIPPVLGGELMRSILTGGNYPESMLSALIERIRAGAEINYLRAAMIKGILTRNHKMEVSMPLDLTNKEPAYLLGRLFAVLEKAQQDALGDINATIKDKYFSSASATPCVVFPILLNLNKHHTSKGEHGGYYDDLNAKIMEELPAKKFPTHLRLEEQGLFSIGYYHQRNDFYKSECACGHRFSSFDASEKPNEKAKSGYRIVACPKCGVSVEVKKQKSKEDKEQKSETN